MNVHCCKVEVSGSELLLVERSPTECGVPECDNEASIMIIWPTRVCCALVKNNAVQIFLSSHRHTK